MDDGKYNAEEAGKTLEQIASENTGNDDQWLASTSRLMSRLSGVGIHGLKKPQTWRILQKDTDGSAEELVFTVHSIVCSLDLPPVLEKPSTTPARYKFFRQGLSITGMGSPTFEEVLASLNELYGRFERQFPDGQLEDWVGATYKDYSALNISNRYLTPKRDAPASEHIPFNKTVDPYGILEKMAKSDYVHSEENEVYYYYIRRFNEDGTKRYKTGQPQNYRIGDIVEIQMSIIAVPLKGRKYKMLTILQSMMLLDDSFTQDAAKRRTTLLKEAGLQPVKRRVQYEDKGKEAKPRMSLDMVD